jgi:hypothetical protein
MKTLILSLFFVICSQFYSQEYVTVQFKSLNVSEYSFLRSHNIDYVCPFGRMAINDKDYMSILTPGGRNLLKRDVEKFKLSNQKQFALDPTKSDTIFNTAQFHNQMYFTENYPVIGYLRKDINDGQIEYIEIVEYKNKFRSLVGNHLEYVFVILVKYKYEQLQKYTFGEVGIDCNDCQVY